MDEYRDLTPNERARVETAEYAAWLKTEQAYSPPPKPDGTDLIHENERVMNALVKVIGLLPALLWLIMCASILVSLDKTAAAFDASVANDGWLAGGWSYIVSLGAVVMTDGALVIAEFMLVRDMLAKDLHREVFTIESVRSWWRVFTGKQPPRDWHEMPDPTLRFYVRFLFALVIAANVFAVTRAGDIRAIDDLRWDNGLLLFTGIAGALSLRLVGKLAAHMVYDLARQRQQLDTAAMYEQWRQEMNERWFDEGPAILAEALHKRYLRKNKLPLEAGSPYLLVAGGEDSEIDLAPFAMPSERALMSSDNGRHYE